MVTKRKTTEFTFCDVQKINDVTVDLKLHACSLLLQLSPGRFRACLSSAPELERFLLDDPIDLGRWRLEAAAVEQGVQADPEAHEDDRERAIDLEDKSGDDIAAYQLAFFLGDVLVAFLLNPVNDDKDEERQETAMKRLVMISTSPVYRRALGDALTDAMRACALESKRSRKVFTCRRLASIGGRLGESAQCPRDGVVNNTWQRPRVPPKTVFAR